MGLTCATIVFGRCVGSYGSLARFTNLRRIRKINETTVVGASGEYSDFQALDDMLDAVMSVPFWLSLGSPVGV